MTLKRENAVGKRAVVKPAAEFQTFSVAGRTTAVAEPAFNFGFVFGFGSNGQDSLSCFCGIADNQPMLINVHLIHNAGNFPVFLPQERVHIIAGALQQKVSGCFFQAAGQAFFFELFNGIGKNSFGFFSFLFGIISSGDWLPGSGFRYGFLFACSFSVF